MKLVRFGAPGREAPGAIAPDGTLRDLSSVLVDLGPEQLSPLTLSELSGFDLGEYPVVAPDVRLGPPLSGTRNFYAIGLNYPMHVAEIQRETTTSLGEPIVFTKATSCITGPFDDLILPPGSLHTDWEVELGLVIGAQAYNVAETDVPAHIAGYLVVNDVSERDFQMNRGGQWVKGKSAPTFGPLGPYFVTADEVGDPQTLDLWLDLNGERMQSSNTREMIFSCNRLVSHLSEFMLLLPGDILTTGTPGGIGAMKDPPRFLREGDVIEAGVEGLGLQKNRVVVSPYPHGLAMSAPIRSARADA